MGELTVITILDLSGSVSQKSAKKLK